MVRQGWNSVWDPALPTAVEGPQATSGGVAAFTRKFVGVNQLKRHRAHRRLRASGWDVLGLACRPTHSSSTGHREVKRQNVYSVPVATAQAKPAPALHFVVWPGGPTHVAATIRRQTPNQDKARELEAVTTSRQEFVADSFGEVPHLETLPMTLNDTREMSTQIVVEPLEMFKVCFHAPRRVRGARGAKTLPPTAGVRGTPRERLATGAT